MAYPATSSIHTVLDQSGYHRSLLVREQALKRNITQIKQFIGYNNGNPKGSIMRLSINVPLFAHIELDSELSGRFGVQGNTFHNTFGYLNQYFKTLPNMPPHMQKLADAMDALVTREDYIRAIRGSVIRPDVLEDLRPYFQMLPNVPPQIPAFSTAICNYIQSIIGIVIEFNTLEAFALKITTEILAGSFPDDIFKNNAYQSLIEQIRFFNGECNGLREQETPLCWLNQTTREKLAFFKRILCLTDKLHRASLITCKPLYQQTSIL